MRNPGSIAIVLAVVAALAGACATDWSGMSESEISQWKGLGVEPDVAQAWAEEGFGPAEYSAWTLGGFDVDGAAKWKAESFTPTDAALWKKAGFDLRDAVANRSKGLTPIDPHAPAPAVSSGDAPAPSEAAPR
jgi:hypothetical protein